MFMTTLISNERFTFFFENLKKILGDGYGHSIVGKKWFPWNPFPLNAPHVQSAFGESAVEVICFLEENIIILRSKKRAETIQKNKLYLFVQAVNGTDKHIVPAVNGEVWEDVFRWLEIQAKSPRK
jgi:hypothetical protein